MVQRSAAFAATVLLVLSLAPYAATQEARPRRPSAALTLARVAVHEAGWRSFETGDLAAIHAVLQGGAERTEVSFNAFAMAYSGRALRGETSRGSWLVQLDPEGRTPTAWPRMTTRCRGRGSREVCAVEPHPPFSNYRESWLETLEHARAVVAGTETHHCASTPHDWGGPSVDRERARRLGLIRIACGETRNDFYARPSLACEPEETREQCVARVSGETETPALETEGTEREEIVSGSTPVPET